jgi:elongation factor G
METARPVQILTVTITPKTHGDHALMRALQHLSIEDPTIRTAWPDSETGRVTIAGVGETHLEVIIDRLKREFGIEGAVGRPGVFLKRAISKSVVGESKYAKTVDGKSQYAHVKLQLTPREDGAGYSFENHLLAGTLPERFIPAIQEGVETARTIGHPFDDVQVELLDGSYHDVDSSEQAFRIAAGEAFWDASSHGKPTIVAPVMRVELALPTIHAARPMKSLLQHEAHILVEQDRGDIRTIVALVRGGQIFGLAGDLRRTTEDVGAFSMRFDHYESLSPLPGEIDLDDQDRDSIVGAPRKPIEPTRTSGIALPEPEEGDPDEDR